MTRENLARALQRAPNDLAEIVQGAVWHNGARLKLGHVEQIGDETVEPLGFVDDGGEQVRLLGFRERFREIVTSGVLMR